MIGSAVVKRVEATSAPTDRAVLGASLNRDPHLVFGPGLAGLGAGGPDPEVPSLDRKLQVGIVNNMPDSAFAATDEQFSGLLGSTSFAEQLSIHRFRQEGAQTRLSRRQLDARGYQSLEHLFGTSLDALVVTGSEPASARLRDDPYWEPIARAVQWALGHTVSTVLSCLAAHVAADLLDGVQRELLPVKSFGVVINRAWLDNSMADQLPATVAIPHSRLNRVSLADLLRVRYQPLLTTEADWSAMTREVDDCLLVLYQGHPEYGRLTLLREYRRDYRRFLRGDQRTAPLPPTDYLAPAAAAIVRQLSQAPLSQTRSATPEFPFAELSEHCSDRWQAEARRLYQNWLQLVAARVKERALGGEGSGS